MAIFTGHEQHNWLQEMLQELQEVLQERETALLSELQQLEDTYRGEGVGKQIDQLRTHKKQTLLKA